MKSAIGKSNSTNAGSKAQAAMEFLVTYGWALIIIGVLAVFMFSYLDAQRSFSSQQCQFAYGVHCITVSAYSNSLETNVVVRFNNSQQYLLLMPGINISAGQYGNSTGGCTPSSVTEGGAITCNAIFTTPLSIGTIISGTMAVNVVVCASGNSNNCQPAQYQVFLGNFSTQVGAKKYV